MKQIIIFPLAFLLLFSTACEKEDKALQTSVCGQVRIKGTEDPIHTGLPIDITLVERYNPQDGGTFGGGGAAFREISTTTTDSLGNFHFSFKGKSSSTFYLRPESVPQPYNFWDDVAGLMDCCSILPGQNQTKHLYFGPPGWLKLRFFNGGPVHVGDYIRYNFGGSTKGNIYGPTENNPDATQLLRLSGNVDYEATFTLFRNENVTQWQESIYVPAFDTAYYELHY